jgi:type VI secretion system lysozyme-like protein
LFDRFLEEEADYGFRGPLRVYSTDMLSESVQRELDRVLNSRSPTPLEELERREWTTLDYGLPDYTGWFTHSRTSQTRLAKLIERTIRAYEPRLREPRVRVEPREGSDRSLDVFISGSVKVGMVMEPISFPLVIRGSTGEE